MDFKNGLRELKQDISDDIKTEWQCENQEDSKNLIHQEGLIGQLNIFCVSSKGYQRLAGRFKRDPMPEGFVTIKETSIPDLQEYAAGSTLTTRTKMADSFLNEFNLLKLSIKSWAENDSPNSLSSSEKGKGKLNDMLEINLTLVHKVFSCALEIAMKRICEFIETYIVPTLKGCIRASTEKAEKACKEFMSSDTSYQTWKAICRRFGKFNNKKNAKHDWNGVFLEPFLGHLAKSRDKVFNSQMQSNHDIYARDLIRAIKKFSADIRPFLRDMAEASASKSPINFLEKIPYLERKTKATVFASLNSAQLQAQDIHRAIEPVITGHLKPAYEACSQPSNTGALARMKEVLFKHIRESNQLMYCESSSLLTSKLSKMTRNVEEFLTTAHTETSDYLRKEIGDMIMLAVAKDDEVREKVRSTLRKDLTVGLSILEASCVKVASRSMNKIEPVKMDRKEDDENDDNTSDDAGKSDSIEGVESTSEDDEDF
ncbi:hypothetical protein DID88_001088 [Monilinia fructigena]|uniref:DUF7605 domain-containing protein n=1 Tax=Monilinia fructigena TaxID=38457 RepID=A0A395IZ52_9HELO|nr:hypothetical protein DID88_001088 [Monilinia fructigena]